jgi:pyruvate,orthophosphate dikinase
LDTRGVGELIRMACLAARAVKPGIKIGVCGEHGGDPKSIAFVQDGLVDYVSCSPWRVPVARLASAQAYLRSQHQPVAPVA